MGTLWASSFLTPIWYSATNCYWLPLIRMAYATAMMTQEHYSCDFVSSLNYYYFLFIHQPQFCQKSDVKQILPSHLRSSSYLVLYMSFVVR